MAYPSDEDGVNVARTQSGEDNDEQAPDNEEISKILDEVCERHRRNGAKTEDARVHGHGRVFLKVRVRTTDTLLNKNRFELELADAKRINSVSSHSHRVDLRCQTLTHKGLKQTRRRAPFRYGKARLSSKEWTPATTNSCRTYVQMWTTTTRRRKKSR